MRGGCAFALLLAGVGGLRVGEVTCAKLPSSRASSAAGNRRECFKHMQSATAASVVGLMLLGDAACASDAPESLMSQLDFLASPSDNGKPISTTTAMPAVRPALNDPPASALAGSDLERALEQAAKTPGADPRAHGVLGLPPSDEPKEGPKSN